MADHGIAYGARALRRRSPRSSQRLGELATGRRGTGDLMTQHGRYARCETPKRYWASSGNGAGEGGRWRVSIDSCTTGISIFNGRTELVQRLLAQQCELCGSQTDCEVHHIRKLADLDQPGRREKVSWAKRMAARHRKTLVVCRRCHQAIHAGRALEPAVTV